MPCAVQIKGKKINKQTNKKPQPTNHKLTEKHKQPLGYELSTQSQKKPVIYKCKLNPVWVKKPGKKGMVSWSLGCSCLPHQYNLISLGQISPSSNTLSQQFNPVSIFLLLDPFINLPAQKLATFSNHASVAGRKSLYLPSNSSSAFQPPLLMLISLVTPLLDEPLLLRKTIKHRVWSLHNHQLPIKHSPLVLT